MSKMSNVQVEIIATKRNFGGRPKSEGWTNFHFERAEGTNGKILAKCMKCLIILKNTSFSRMSNHRRKCGPLGEEQKFASPTTCLEKVVKSKVEYEEEQPASTMIWSPPGTDSYIEEPLAVETVNQTAMEIINDDIKRHRKSSKQKVRLDSNSLDSALPSFLIGCNLTFDIVDSEHFKKFVHALNPNYSLPTSNQLKAKVLSQLDYSEKKIKKRRYYVTSESETD